MTAPVTPTVREHDAIDWVGALSAPGPQHELAMRELHQLLVRAARTQVLRMRGMLGGAGIDVVEELAQQAADEAMVSLLAKLGTFEGRSRFTTWAFKFGILHAATAVRQRAWAGRDVPLGFAELMTDPTPGPQEYAESHELVLAVRDAVLTGLTPHQRRVVVALLVDEVPIDVLAQRLGATRNALYKTLHDARVRIRAELRRSGHLAVADLEEGAR